MSAWRTEALPCSSELDLWRLPPLCRSMPSPTEMGWGDGGTSEGSGFSALPISDTGGLAWRLGRLEKIKKHSPSFSSYGFQSVDRETAISFDFSNRLLLRNHSKQTFQEKVTMGAFSKIFPSPC